MKPFSRRDLMRHAVVGVTGASACGWFGSVAAATSTSRARGKAVILLWLSGGPATIDMWDLKPGHANGGPFREIETVANDVRISEHLPKLAKCTNEMAIIRSMSTKEGDHGRASHLLRTGYVPQGPLQFPSLGSLLSRETGSSDADIPNFVSINPNRNSRMGGGFLGPKYAPLVVGQGAKDPGDLVVPDIHLSRDITAQEQAERVSLMENLDRRFIAQQKSAVAEAIQAASLRAVRLMSPAAAAAFRLEDEPDHVRDAFGRNVFGQGCLLARRLVERGVPFVEIALDGWDTHQNNFAQVKQLSATLDAGYSTLISDLKDRGLLDSTLIVCQGEFGRTPAINGNQGRDHWPNSWAVAMAGGLVKTGQVIGKTSADGSEVTERPVTVPDLIATVVKAVGIDPQKQNISNSGRPIRIADAAAKPIQELL